jgi:hypothetical protein
MNKSVSDNFYSKSLFVINLCVLEFELEKSSLISEISPYHTPVLGDTSYDTLAFESKVI